MTMKDINNKTNAMIKHFLNCLNCYKDNYNNCPIIFGDLSKDYKKARGKFFAKESEELFLFLNKTDMSEISKYSIFSTGLIVIDNSYKDDFNHNNIDLIDTIIHEKLHANRSLKIRKQNKTCYKDPLQEILLGENISDSKQKNAKMNQQIKIDEALITIMSIITWKLYTKESNDIMKMVEFINNKTKQKDIKSMTNIILRHNDLDLLRWMINPLEYQNNDIYYDYFNDYIDENDMYDLYVITNSKSVIKHDKTDYKCLFPKNIKRLKQKSAK